MEMLFKDEESWKLSVQNNSDPYGAAAVNYAKQWALLMQAEIAAGRTLEEVAERTSNEADTEGITGFMYGCAVALLAKVWVHGEALRCWSNLKLQLGKEGEAANASGRVLNPALISIDET